MDDNHLIVAPPRCFTETLRRTALVIEECEDVSDWYAVLLIH